HTRSKRDWSSDVCSSDLFFLVLQTQIGVGVLSLAFNVFNTAEQDGWISTLIAGLAIQVAIIIIWMMARRFPSSTIFDILPQLLRSEERRVGQECRFRLVR